MTEEELGLIAQGQQRWVERWYGSEPMKGSAIVTENRDEVAVLGGDKETHRAVRKIVMAHNAAIAPQLAPEQPKFSEHIFVADFYNRIRREAHDLAINASLDVLAIHNREQKLLDIVERLATGFYPTLEEAIEAAQIALGDAP